MNSKKNRPKRSAREIRKQLRSLYETVDGHVPDLTTLDQGKHSKTTRFLFKVAGVLAVISVLAWLGFFLFSNGLFQEQETLRLTIDGPEEIQSGEEVSYTFRYENVGTVPVASLTMTLNVPQTFHVYSTVPEPDQPLEWTIGSLSAGSDGAITLTGVFLAEVPSSQRLQALFHYKPANFSSDFQDIVTQKVEVEDSVIELSFTGPEKALAGDASEYIVNIQNTGLDPVYNLRVTPSFSKDFTIESSEPSLEEEAYWSIDALEPGELAAITIQGVFTSSASEEQPLLVSVGFVQDDIVYVQQSEELLTDVLGGTVSFSTIVNGSTENQTAEVGETLRLSIDYTNNNKEISQEMSVNLQLSSDGGDLPIDWNQANLGGGTRVGNEISWENLDALEPETSRVIDVSLPIKNSITSTEADAFTLSTTLTLNKVGTVTSTRTLETTPITISLNSDLSSTSQARYYSDNGTPIGSGPLPPEVGETTSYRIYWDISNSLHTLEDIQLSATLPQDVTWIDNTDTDIGRIDFNSTTRQVTWTIPKLLSELTHAGAWFEVAINPNTNDVGHFVKLTSSTSLESKDTKTGEILHLSGDEITTELPEDEFAFGNGVVIE